MEMMTVTMIEVIVILIDGNDYSDDGWSKSDNNVVMVTVIIE